MLVRSVQPCGAIIKFGSHCGLHGTTKRTYRGTSREGQDFRFSQEVAGFYLLKAQATQNSRYLESTSNLLSGSVARRLSKHSQNPGP